jgi:hypothetical protein
VAVQSVTAPQLQQSLLLIQFLTQQIAEQQQQQLWELQQLKQLL